MNQFLTRTLFASLFVLAGSQGSALAQESTSGDARVTDVAPLDSIRNYHHISADLMTGGQVGYDQVPLLKSEGIQTVINLATASEEYNAMEGFHVTSAGMTYVQIPVVWSEPSLDDLDQFFEVMKANDGRKLFVHCIANMRASAFIYLYRVLVDGVDESDALEDLHAVWNPVEYEQWQQLIDDALASPRFLEKN